jgi:hypothetical protein
VLLEETRICWKAVKVLLRSSPALEGRCCVAFTISFNLLQWLRSSPTRESRCCADHLGQPVDAVAVAILTDPRRVGASVHDVPTDPLPEQVAILTNHDGRCCFS